MVAKKKDGIEVDFDPNGQFKRSLEKAIKVTEDLTIPFIEITKSWFKSNEAIFNLKSKGKFADLSDTYKKTKQKKLGFVYPILEGENKAIKESLTAKVSRRGKAQNKDSISQVVNKNTLIIGTKVEYAPYLQDGTNKMPARPFVLVGAEQTGPPEFNKRLDAWVSIIDEFVFQNLNDLLGS